MRRGCAAALAVSLAGCGFRSNPVDAGADGQFATDVGTCQSPSRLEEFDTRGAGAITASGSLEGWCGADRGGEVVYRLSPIVSTDVTIAFVDDLTDDGITLRVLDGFCGSDRDGTDTLVCDTDPLRTVSPSAPRDRHFFAQGERDYYVIVDGEGPGQFAFDMTLGEFPVRECNVHTDAIVQDPGETFGWENEFERGHGRIDGACGGVGKEDVFAVEADHRGRLTITARGTGGYDPVVSLRRACGGATELGCAGGEGDGEAELAAVIPGPGTYYVVVDGVGIDAGGYDLEVRFLD